MQCRKLELKFYVGYSTLHFDYFNFCKNILNLSVSLQQLKPQIFMFFIDSPTHCTFISE